ncbi:MAG: Hsp70 family protein, partial [Rhodococcus sp. (in: high G+C Gram-positive bacteria)]
MRTTDGLVFSVEQFPSAGPVPDADDVAHAIRAIVDRVDAPHSLGVAFPDPSYSKALKAALVEEYVSEVHIISEISGTVEMLRADADFRYRTVALYDLGATGLELTVADIESGTVYATTRSAELSGMSIDLAVRDHLLTLDILAEPRTHDEESSLLAFSREIKEALSSHEATQTSDGQFPLMDRRMLDLQIIRSAERSAIALRDLTEMSEIPPEVVVAIGGGARIPLVEEVLRRYLRIPVVVPPEPELVAAQGAALYAARVDAVRPATPPSSRRSARTLLTPLLRFGLPSVAILGFLSWMLWPDATADRSVAGTPVTTIAETAG